MLLRPSVDISNETSHDMLLMASFRLSATPISRCGWGGRERQRTEARHVRICAGQLAGEQGDERQAGVEALARCAKIARRFPAGMAFLPPWEAC